jgi:hypothetical protein
MALAQELPEVDIGIDVIAAEQLVAALRTR